MTELSQPKDTQKVYERLKVYNTIQDEKQCIDFYQKMAKNYEKDITTAGWPDPEVVAKSLDMLDLGKEIKILDFGCGTGLLGYNLKALGYKNVTGLDASDEMLKKAQEKDSYIKLDKCLLGSNQFPEELKGKFDVAVCSGVLAKNHCPKETFAEMVQCLDPQGKCGYCVFSMRLDEYTKVNHLLEIQKLEKEDKWKKIGETKFTKFGNMPQDQQEFIRAVDAHCFVYRRV